MVQSEKDISLIPIQKINSISTNKVIYIQNPQASNKIFTTNWIPQMLLCLFQLLHASFATLVALKVVAVGNSIRLLNWRPAGSQRHAVGSAGERRNVPELFFLARRRLTISDRHPERFGRLRQMAAMTSLDSLLV